MDSRGLLDRVTDGAEDLADLAAQEDEGHDRHDRDEGEDQRVLGEALAFLVTIEEVHDCKIDRRHAGEYLLSVGSPRSPGAAPRYGRTLTVSIGRPAWVLRRQTGEPARRR